jgi:hypothetical protein
MIHLSVLVDFHDLIRNNAASKNKAKKAKKKKALILPWWCKIFAYMLSFAMISTSITFILFKGIMLGNDAVAKWLTSFLVSALSTCFITQPAEVALVALLMVLIFKKSDDDVDYDKYDDGHSLNEFYKPGDSKAPARSQHRRNLTSEDHADQKVILEFEKSFKRAIRNAILYGMFLAVVSLSAYSKVNPRSYQYRLMLASNFNLGNDVSLKSAQKNLNNLKILKII